MPTSSPLVECRRWPKRRESKAPAGDELAGALGHLRTRRPRVKGPYEFKFVFSS